MSFLDWLFGTAKIKELQSQITFLKNNQSLLEIDKSTLKSQIDVLNKVMDGANKSIIELNNTIKLLKEPTHADKPVWIDDKGDVYKPNIVIVAKGSTYNVQIDPLDIYASCPTLEKIVSDYGLDKLSTDQKLYQIWSFVTDRCDYEYDANDSWEFPTTTYYRRKGDCEDTTVLFVELCRLSGIKSDCVFNVTGWWHMSDGSLVGHSYPIALCDDGKWYVYETTITSINSSYKPILFKGSNYTADWGCSNWEWKGRINGQNQI
jgi:hypothetical protein